MVVRPIGPFLEHFEENTPLGETQGVLVEPDPLLLPSPQEPPPALLLVHDPYEEGLKEGERRAQQTYTVEKQTLISTLNAEHEQHMNTLLTTHLAPFAHSYQESLREILEQISTHVASVLEPWMEENVKTLALDDLSTRLRAFTTSCENLHISGPSFFLSALKERGFVANYTVSEETDVTVSLDHTVLQTTLSTWKERFLSPSKTPSAPPLSLERSA